MPEYELLYRCKYWRMRGGRNRVLGKLKVEQCLAKGCRKLQSFVKRREEVKK